MEEESQTLEPRSVPIGSRPVTRGNSRQGPRARPSASNSNENSAASFKLSQTQQVSPNHGAFSNGQRKSLYQSLGDNSGMLPKNYDAVYSEDEGNYYTSIGSGPKRATNSGILALRNGHRQYSSNHGNATLSVKSKKRRKIFAAIDKDRMNDQSIGLKLKMNVIQDENIKLKTQCLQYENELKKYSKIMEEMHSQQQQQQQHMQPPGYQGYKKDTLLVMNLKEKCKQLQRSLVDKDNEVFNMKQNIKLTKIEELEEENKVLIQECQRLRSFIEEMYSAQKANGGQDPGVVQEMQQLLQSLREENQQLVQVLQSKDQENLEQLKEIDQRGKQIVQLNQKVMNSPNQQNKLKVLKQERQNSINEIKTLKQKLEEQKKCTEKTQKQVDKDKKDQYTIKKLKQQNKDLEENNKTLQSGLDMMCQEKSQFGDKLEAIQVQLKQEKDEHRDSKSIIQQQTDKIRALEKQIRSLKDKSQMSNNNIESSLPDIGVLNEAIHKISRYSQSLSIPKQQLISSLSSPPYTTSQLKSLFPIINEKELGELASHVNGSTGSLFSDYVLYDQHMIKIEDDVLKRLLKVLSTLSEINDQAFKEKVQRDVAGIQEEEIECLVQIGLQVSGSWQEINAKKLIDLIKIEEPQKVDFKLDKEVVSAIKRYHEMNSQQLDSIQLNRSEFDLKRLKQSLDNWYGSFLNISQIEEFSQYLLGNDQTKQQSEIEYNLQTILNDSNNKYAPLDVEKATQIYNQVGLSQILKKIQTIIREEDLTLPQLQDEDRNQVILLCLKYSNHPTLINPAQVVQSVNEQDQQELEQQKCSDSGSGSRQKSNQEEMHNNPSDAVLQGTIDKDKQEEEDLIAKALNEDENNFVETEQALEIGRNAYIKLAKILYEKNLSVKDLFGDLIFDDYVYGKVEELVTKEDFVNTLQEIGFGELTKEEDIIFCARLQRAQMKDEMIINDLQTDLFHLGIVDQVHRKRDGLDYDTLEPKSFRIINRILNYLKENNIPDIETMFKDEIELIEVKGLDATENLEIIASEDFFNKLHALNLKRNPSQFLNLSEFLCIDKDYVVYLRLDKLKRFMSEIEQTPQFQRYGCKKRKRQDELQLQQQQLQQIEQEENINEQIEKRPTLLNRKTGGRIIDSDCDDDEEQQEGPKETEDYEDDFD